MEEYTYGVYGELLSGNAALTRYLYNGRYGVSTDGNGLYYMRRRYYNPETRRFINRDVISGNIQNSQSLNRYSYVQGNPVSYTDPFGLSSLSALFMSKEFWHLVLGVAGCVPGPVGIVSNLVDALIYALGDHDYWMTAWCLLSAGSLGCGSVIKIAAQGGRLSQTAMKGMRAFNLMSNTISFAKGASNFSETCYQIYQKYTVEGRPVSIMSISEDARNLKYSIETCILSGIGIRGNTKGLTGGSNFRNQDLLDSHYNKHVNEFGNISKEEYLKGANNLVDSKGDDILTKIRENGDTIYYNTNTNEFAVKSADGYIRTYFKPLDGIDYFNKQ